MIRFLWIHVEDLSLRVRGGDSMEAVTVEEFNHFSAAMQPQELVVSLLHHGESEVVVLFRNWSDFVALNAVERSSRSSYNRTKRGVKGFIITALPRVVDTVEIPLVECPVPGFQGLELVKGCLGNVSEVFLVLEHPLATNRAIGMIPVIKASDVVTRDVQLFGCFLMGKA